MKLFGLKQNSLRDWFIMNADRRSSRYALNAISFAESSIFPVPPDPFLMALTLVKPKKWVSLSLYTTIFSVLGGLLGYLIGYAFFTTVGESLVELYHLHDELQALGQTFENHSFLAMFIAALVPVIPYKLFTITAGVFGINLVIFVAASIIGRGIRFFLIGFVMRFIGEKFGEQIFDYFNILATLAVVLVILFLIFK